MRLLSSLVMPLLTLTLIVPTVAFADTAVEDEPMPRQVGRAPSERKSETQALPARASAPHAPSEVGQLRAARMTAPDPVSIDSSGAVAREHEVAPPHPVAATATATDGDMLAELAARQLSREAKRHQRAIDGCLAAAHQRAPAAAGSITLDFEVTERKIKSVVISDDGLHDTQLAACLTSAARAFTFSLASARFRWPVALHP